MPETNSGSPVPRIYNLEIDDALKAFDTSSSGLSSQEAARRNVEFGLNTLQPKIESLLKRIIEPFSNMFVTVLLFALFLSVLEREIVDAIIIAIIVGVNAVIFYFQQYSVGRVLRSLKEHDIARVDVFRDRETVKINSDYLTYGDIVVVEEGMKVPADGRLIEANQIQADEAMLTGESLPVHKQAGAVDGDKQLYDQRNMLFKGTYIKAGTGLMMVTGIDNKTELGNITTLASMADMGKSPIERKIDDLTRKLIIVIGFAALLALGLAIYRGIPVEEALRFSLTIVVSAVPEGLPVALTIVLLLSARRMARANALVKKISSIETMGALTLIVTDKTGTITQNKLSVADKHTTHGTPHTFDEVVRASLNDHGDPLDGILADAVRHVEVPESWSKTKEFAFNQQLRASAVVWQHSQGFTLFIKGAPEHVLSHCSVHHRHDLQVQRALQDFTGRGYRTLAFAHKDFLTEPAELDAAVLSDMEFDGFVGMADRLRPHISEAVIDAQRAGVKVVMLTGDHVATAAFIARQVGIVRQNVEVQDSSILMNGSVDDIREALKSARVFGRVLPEHKYALLKATKDSEITAMTGDGVNDIPALVEADAGIAMGGGSEAAKDASDIVLLDDNFNTLVSAMKVGRTALANIRKMLIYLLGTSAGEVMTMIAALVFGMPLPVAAIQILWINLVTDGVSVIPLGMSPGEPRQMLQPPRHPDAPLLNTRQTTRVVLMSVVMSAGVLLVFDHFLDKGLPYARTLAFLSLIVVQWANALNVNVEYRSWVYNFIRPNLKLWGALGFSVILQVAVFMSPVGRYLHVVPVRWQDAAVAIIVPVAAVLVAVDIHKFIWHHIPRR